ncbi:MAG: class II fructose-bisphosphate aldolase [Spirochaetales bacterium]|nr:class II fructose-bisphosphate aldolase [Spirochaetales bacterium]
MKELLRRAREEGSAVIAVNVSNMESIKGVLDAASSERRPVILQIAPIQLREQSMQLAEFVAVARAIGRFYTAPYALHLDHATALEEVEEAVEAGFDSVMYDGSALPFEENLHATRRSRALCDRRGVTLEAELGSLGGEEGGRDTADGGEEPPYTDPVQAREFVASSGVDALAVAIGNRHGSYHGPAALRIDILDLIGRAARIPLVLHGASGIDDDQLRRCIERGIAKVNYYTDIDRAFMRGLRDALGSGDEPPMMRAVESGRLALREAVRGRIAACAARR